MIRILLIIIFLYSGFLQAQDFTNKVLEEVTEKGNDRILLIPFKSQFLLSEIDRGLVNNSGKEVFEVREGITQTLVEETSKLFQDSISCRALDKDLEPSNLTYIYRQLSYGYAEIPKSDTEEKKKFSLKRKVEEKTPLGHRTRINGGQIARDPIFTERYMSARITSPELMEFVNTEYQSELIVIFTELDLMKAKGNKMVEDYDYIATLHYVIYDNEGNLLEGNKAEKYFNNTEFNLSSLYSDVLNPLSQSIHNRTILYLSNNSSYNNEMEDKDY